MELAGFFAFLARRQRLAYVAAPSARGVGAPKMLLATPQALLPQRKRSCRPRRCSVTRAAGPDGVLGLLSAALPGLPKGAVVGLTQQAWSASWRLMMGELAPQSQGRYVRPASSIGGVVSRAPGAAFPADSSGRYLLYVGAACPWCHRATLTLALRGMAAAVRVVQLRGAAESAGWAFVSADPVVPSAATLRDTYAALAPAYAGRPTAPLLVDARTRRAVSNDSAAICRMLNDAFDAPAAPAVQLRPRALEAEIDALNARLYEDVNDGVYRCGFATTQTAYNTAQAKLRATLEMLDARLATRRFLHGQHVTESDVRLFPTVVRLDAVYTSLFKCAVSLAELPHLDAWAKDVYRLPGVAATVDLDACRAQYYGTLFPLNPGGIVPAGPTLQALGFGRDPGRGARDDCFPLQAQAESRPPAS